MAQSGLSREFSRLYRITTCATTDKSSTWDCTDVGPANITSIHSCQPSCAFSWSPCVCAYCRFQGWLQPLGLGEGFGP